MRRCYKWPSLKCQAETRLSEQPELLAGSSKDLILLDLDNVPSHGLRKWTALSDSSNVTLLHVECRGAVRGNVLVALLEAIELLDVVKVVSADDHRVLHLCRYNHSLQDVTTDADIA